MTWAEAVEAMRGGAVVERDGEIFSAVQFRMVGSAWEGRILDEATWDDWEPFAYHLANEASLGHTYRLVTEEGGRVPQDMPATTTDNTDNAARSLSACEDTPARRPGQGPREDVR